MQLGQHESARAGGWSAKLQKVVPPGQDFVENLADVLEKVDELATLAGRELEQSRCAGHNAVRLAASADIRQAASLGGTSRASECEQAQAIRTGEGSWHPAPACCPGSYH